jgi:hypothetical protein
MATEVHALDAKWAGPLRLGGIVLVVSGFLYGALTYLGMYVYGNGSVPNDTAAYLEQVGGHSAAATVAWSLWIGTDLLLIPILAALYLVLRYRNLILTVFGTTVVGIYAVFDVAVTETNSLTLASLARGYTSASSVAVQTRYLTAATAGVAALPMETLLSFVIGSFGLLILSAVMLGGPVRKGTAWLGIGANSLAIVAGVGAVVPALSLVTNPSLLLVGLWYVLLGIQLHRLGGKLLPTPQPRPEPTPSSQSRRELGGPAGRI